MELRILYIATFTIEAVIAWLYFNRIFRAKYEEWKSGLYLLAGYFFLFLLSDLGTVWVNILGFMVVNVILLVLAYQVTMSHAIFHSFIMTVVMSLLELGTAGVLGMFSSQFSISEKYVVSMIWLLAISKLLSYIVLISLTKLLGTYKKQKVQHDQDFIMLIVVPFCSFGLLLVLFSIGMDAELSHRLEMLIALSALMLFVINIAICLVYNHVQKRNEELLEAQLLLQKEHHDAEYYKRLLQQDEHQKIVIHDMINHMHSIESLLSAEDVNHAKDYIKQLYKMPEFKEMIKLSDNHMLNLILNRYLMLCNNIQVKLNIDIRKNSVEFLNADDITALFCNLLDNAMEAVEKIEDAYIDLRVWNRASQDMTVITMVNPCRHKPNMGKHALPETTKKNRNHHGFGMKSIARVAGRYQGELENYYNEEDSTFHTTITLYKNRAVS